ncbi:hypothetical protein U1Q18_007948 [Sarracenia purpurea var. burkii]
MKSKGMIKKLGWSWIKIKDQVSAFVASDQLHPECENIYSTLDLLTSREELTVPEMGSLIYDGKDLQVIEQSFAML